MVDRPSPPDPGTASLPQDPTEASPVLGRIGDYRLIQRLGSGGMGEVYEAEQEQPVRRVVALKLIKPGMDTREVVARFESERQALALLSHPCIAQVYDAGTTEDGRPYFVMERVWGIPIRDYCDRNTLTIPDRLRLFQLVCQAVQHAHTKGIIHRDLKSSNILVSAHEGGANPKIIDFGIAKATGAKLGDKTVHTRFGQVVGTLEYMSPEQAGLTPYDIDTRSDVYSLGVLLYELLTGARPISGSGSGDTGLFRLLERIQSEEPLKPSAKVAAIGGKADAIAVKRQTEIKALTASLRGDLDWISLRALEKDRARRYGSASELAADIGRHLEHEPVLASPPSTWYRARKFARRHRAGVIAAGAVAVALVAGILGTTGMLLRALRAERQAREEAETARHTSDFLIDIFKVSDPGESRGNTITAREILDRGAKQIEGQLHDQPLVHSRLLSAMGAVYRGLGLYPESRKLLERALDVKVRKLGPDHVEVAAAHNALADVHLQAGEFHEGIANARRALAINRRALGPDHVQTAWSAYYLGSGLAMSGDLRGGERYLREAEPVFRRHLGPESLPLGWCLNDLGMIHMMERDHAAALPLLLQSERIKTRSLGEDHPDVLMSRNNIAYDYVRLGKPEEGLRWAEQALKTSVSVAGPKHPTTAQILQTKGEALRLMGALVSAESAMVASLAIQELARVEHPELALSYWNLAAVRGDLGRIAEAEAGFHRSVDMYTRIDSMYPDLVPCLEEYARILERAGRGDEAKPYRARAERIRGALSSSTSGTR